MVFSNQKFLQQHSAGGTLTPQIIQQIQQMARSGRLGQALQNQQNRFPQVDGPSDDSKGNELMTFYGNGNVGALSREAADLLLDHQAALIYAQRSRETAELRAALLHANITEGGSNSPGGLNEEGVDIAKAVKAGKKSRRRKPQTGEGSSIAEEDLSGGGSGESDTAIRQVAIPQMDGDVNEDEEEEEDGADGAGSDGIGSDLDSDSSGTGPEESDLCLCQYDKVQRTRNKWRCGFRDGVLNIAGKDYLFHRAGGDFEW
ncbi:transcription factor IIA subunit alpha [Gonapodya sp. JEL0774]|nr:transcription factor IIA subunit alpha [Gonapodya sp. JEL0774]